MNTLLPSSLDRLAHGVDLWFASTDGANDPEVLRSCHDLLPANERADCARYRREVDRRRAVVARFLVRTTLSRYAAVPPADWRFVRGLHGRPEIESPAGTTLRFNVSHTGERVACAVTSAAEIGVDLEEPGRVPGEQAVVEFACSDEEIEELRGESERQDVRFIELWTLKEAYLKARGLGLSTAPKSVSFDLRDPASISVRFGSELLDRPDTWWFALLEVEGGKILALARRGGRADLSAFHMAPPETTYVPAILRTRAMSSARKPTDETDASSLPSDKQVPYSPA